MLSFNFKKISYITITSTCLNPSKHHASSTITHHHDSNTQAPPLTDPFGFHLTLQRDPGGSQRLAAALWMSPQSTLCGDEIYCERLEFVVPLMRWERKVRRYRIHPSMWLPRGASGHTQAMMVGIIAFKREDIIVSCIW